MAMHTAREATYFIEYLKTSTPRSTSSRKWKQFRARVLRAPLQFNCSSILAMHPPKRTAAKGVVGSQKESDCRNVQTLHLNHCRHQQLPVSQPTAPASEKSEQKKKPPIYMRYTNQNYTLRRFGGFVFVGETGRK